MFSAFTEVILERTQLNRLLFPPPRSVEWPPRRLGRWSEAVEEAGRQWSVWAEDPQGLAPDLVAEEWSVIRDRSDTLLDHVAEGQDWRLCEAVKIWMPPAGQDSIAVDTTLDALISAVDNARDENGIDRLARKVLRSALEQRRFRIRETASYSDPPQTPR